MPIKTAWLGQSGLTDVGYQLFDETHAPVGLRVTEGISDIGGGWYEAAAHYDITSFSGYIYWNTPTHPESDSLEYIGQVDGVNSFVVTVTDAVTSKPIVGAIVRASNEEVTHTAKTNVNGIAKISLTPNDYVVSTIRDGYAYISKNLSILGDDDTIFQVYPNIADIHKVRLAEQIWRDAQLPVETFSFSTEDDAIQWITSTVLPETEAYVDAKLNHAVMPYNYPLETVIVQRAFPNQTYTYVSTLVTSWESSRANIVKFMALYRLFLMADSVKKEYLAKAEALKRAADDMLLALTQTLQGIVATVAAGGRKFGFVVVRLPRQRKLDNEFSTWM